MCMESASCCPFGLQDISRKDISASCPDSPLLPPSSVSFPTLCVEWRSLALADGKNRISHSSNSIICVSGSFCVVAWRRKLVISWLTFIYFFLFLTTMTEAFFRIKNLHVQSEGLWSDRWLTLIYRLTPMLSSSYQPEKHLLMLTGASQTQCLNRCC